MEKEYCIAHRLGTLLFRSGDTSAAIEVFNEAAGLDPTNPSAWSTLRDALFSVHRLDEAKLADAKFKEFSERLSVREITNG